MMKAIIFIIYLSQIIIFGYIYQSYYKSYSNNFVFNSEIYQAKLIASKSDSINILKSITNINILLKAVNTLDSNSVDKKLRFAKYLDNFVFKHLSRKEQKEMDLVDKEFFSLFKNNKTLKDTIILFHNDAGLTLIQTVNKARRSRRNLTLQMEIKFKNISKKYHIKKNSLDFFLKKANLTTKVCLKYIKNQLLSEKYEYHNILDEFSEPIYKKKIFRYWDFLYFSVITSTTVGYGDILPNSTIVRKVVATQCIISVTLTVFFISINYKKQIPIMNQIPKKTKIEQRLRKRKLLKKIRNKSN